MRPIRSSGVGNCLILHVCARVRGIDHRKKERIANPRGYAWGSEGRGGVMVTGQIEPFLKHCLKQCLFSSISRQYCCNARESNFGFCVFSAW